MGAVPGTSHEPVVTPWERCQAVATSLWLRHGSGARHRGGARHRRCSTAFHSSGSSRLPAVEVWILDHNLPLLATYLIPSTPDDLPRELPSALEKVVMT
jgi:hypothetical protein